MNLRIYILLKTTYFSEIFWYQYYENLVKNNSVHIERFKILIIDFFWIKLFSESLTNQSIMINLLSKY